MNGDDELRQFAEFLDVTAKLRAELPSVAGNVKTSRRVVMSHYFRRLLPHDRRLLRIQAYITIFDVCLFIVLGYLMVAFGYNKVAISEPISLSIGTGLILMGIAVFHQRVRERSNGHINSLITGIRNVQIGAKKVENALTTRSDIIQYLQQDFNQWDEVVKALQTTESTEIEIVKQRFKAVMLNLVQHIQQLYDTSGVSREFAVLRKAIREMDDIVVRIEFDYKRDIPSSYKK